MIKCLSRKKIVVGVMGLGASGLVRPFAFSNSGEIGYDAVIKRILIALKFPDGSEYEQEWYEFVTFSIEDGQLQKGPVKPAVPLQIRAKNAISRDIYFTPFSENKG